MNLVELLGFKMYFPYFFEIIFNHGIPLLHLYVKCMYVFITAFPLQSIRYMYVCLHHCLASSVCMLLVCVCFSQHFLISLYNVICMCVFKVDHLISENKNGVPFLGEDNFSHSVYFSCLFFCFLRLRPYSLSHPLGQVSWYYTSSSHIKVFILERVYGCCPRQY